MKNNKQPNLFTPVKVGRYTLPNRIVMPPMSRVRALGNVPQPIMATYYAQRASAGLLIAEPTAVSPLGKMYLNGPEIDSPDQVKGWRRVTESVHAQGGRIFLQLLHGGRAASSKLLNGEMPLAPSPIADGEEVIAPYGKVVLDKPRILETHEIPEIIGQFSLASENAIAAGFDGVELQCGLGYLID